MPHREPRPQPEQPYTERQIREYLMGVGEEQEFGEVIGERLVSQPASRGVPGELQPEVLGKLEALHIPPAAAPAARSRKFLTDESWDAVAGSAHPLLTLWSRRYLERARTIFKNADKSALRHIRTRDFVQKEEALWRSLPLLQFTSVEALEGALATGNMLSNRQLYERGVDVTGGVGQTHGLDRELGLDDYVFFDFARPASIRGDNSEVIIVTEPEAMQTEGAFLTEKDIMDVGYDGDSPDYRQYMSGAVEAKEFAEAGRLNLLADRSLRGYYAGRGLGTSYYPMELSDFAAGSDCRPDQFGRPHFSTWEVKIPRQVSTDFIRRVVFTDRQKFEAFIGRHQDKELPFTVVYADKPPKGGIDPTEINETFTQNMQLLGTGERYERELAALRQADYEQRFRVIGEADPNSVREGFMLIDHPDPHAPDAIRYDPYWYSATSTMFGSQRLMFGSAEEAAATYEQAVHSQNGWHQAHIDGAGGQRWAIQILRRKPQIAKIRFTDSAAITDKIYTLADAADEK